MEQELIDDAAAAMDHDGQQQQHQQNVIPQQQADVQQEIEIMDESEGDDDDDDDVDVDVDDEDFDEIYSSDSSHYSTLSLLSSFVREVSQTNKSKRIYEFKPLQLEQVHFITKNKDGEYPLARSGHRIIASESHLYSLGGYNPRSAEIAELNNQCLLYQELWSYNFATQRWKLEMNAETAKEMPVELASNALAIHNNVLISHGGTGYPFGEFCSNDCYVYTTTSSEQKQRSTVSRLKVTGDLPAAQYGPGIVIHDNYLYTIGGTTGFEYSCDVYRLDLRTRVWENVYICRPEMREDPEGRYRHEVVYDGNHIFVLGGGTSHSVYDLQRIPAYNLKENCWDYFDTKPDRSMLNDEKYPKPRKCFSCVQHTLSNGEVEAFITGGLQGDFSTYFSDIWKLNLATKQWTRIQTAKLPKPLYFHSAAHSDNGCMYIFGGIEYVHMHRKNHLYKMWMTIPKLSEMCWDAITYYNDNLDKIDRNQLRNIGIPMNFVKRLPMCKTNTSEHSDSSLSLFNKRPRVHIN